MQGFVGITTFATYFQLRPFLRSADELRQRTQIKSVMTLLQGRNPKILPLKFSKTRLVVRYNITYHHFAPLRKYQLVVHLHCCHTFIT